MDRVLTEKMSLLGISGLGNAVDNESTVRLEEMKAEIKVMSLSRHVGC